jgi:hypothetical protein
MLAGISSAPVAIQAVVLDSRVINYLYDALRMIGRAIVNDNALPILNALRLQRREREG